MRSQIFLLLKSHPYSPKTAFSIAFEVAGESFERIEKRKRKEFWSLKTDLEHQHAQGRLPNLPTVMSCENTSFDFDLLVCFQASKQLSTLVMSAWRRSSGDLQTDRYWSTNLRTALKSSLFRFFSIFLTVISHFSWSFNSAFSVLKKKAKSTFQSFFTEIKVLNTLLSWSC